MLDSNYRYLDTEKDRELLMADIRDVRRSVIQLTETVPEDKWFEPRYHGWSLAAMLGHLVLMDNLYMVMIQLALLNIRIPIPEQMVNQFNDLTANVFRQRVVESSLRGIEAKEPVLEKFIMTLPIDKFTKTVYYPPDAKHYTVEQAIQVLFLHHWQNHLQTMLEVEGIEDRPQSDSN
jgi:hypothetical protein